LRSALAQTDIHRAPKIDELARLQVQGAEFVHVRLQRGKTDITHSLHAAILEEGTGVLLHRLGFQKSPCQFTTLEMCWGSTLDSAVDFASFVSAFTEAREKFRAATSILGSCGVSLEPRPGQGAGFDGHTGGSTKRLKEAADERFRYVLSWIEGDRGRIRGWVTHYHPLAPLPADLEALVTGVLEMEPHAECPELDFDPCFWTFTPAHIPDRRFPMALNADIVHARFEQSPGTFVAGLEALAGVNKALRPVGLCLTHRIVPGLKTLVRRAEAIVRSSPPAAQAASESGVPGLDFDVALSFAGPQRGIAEEFFGLLTARGLRVFYDKNYTADLWGRDLTETLDEIYRKRSRLCVPFVSQAYAEKTWPRQELRSARARAIEEKSAYILPIRVDASVDLPGLPPTIAYLSLSEYTLDEIADILARKLSQTP